jgi:hypothetical protein
MRIVDNKRVNMTSDESTIYDNIVKSNTTATNKGEDLFIGLFETNDEGIILFLRPPDKRQTTMQVWLFLMSLQQHQHLRQMYKEVGFICDQMKEKMAELDKKLAAK